MYWVWEGLRPLAMLWGLYRRHHGRKDIAPRHSGTRKVQLASVGEGEQERKTETKFSLQT
jgi:hypothetical protein